GRVLAIPNKKHCLPIRWESHCLWCSIALALPNVWLSFCMMSLRCRSMRLPPSSIELQKLHANLPAERVKEFKPRNRTPLPLFPNSERWSTHFLQHCGAEISQGLS